MKIETINSGMDFADQAKTAARTNETKQEVHAAETVSAALPVPGNLNNISSSENTNTKEEEQQKQETTSRRVKNAVSEANKRKNARTRCEFAYHETTKRVSIKVIDKDTEKVIREIPPEETLEMVEKMWELAGILVDERR